MVEAPEKDGLDHNLPRVKPDESEAGIYPKVRVFDWETNPNAAFSVPSLL